MRLFLAIALALFAATPAMAQDEVVGGVPGGVRNGDLVVAVVHTDDRDAFVRAWAASATSLPLHSWAVRGQPLTVVVVFRGCGAGADGKCNLTGHFTYLRPDGSVAGEIDGQLWTEGPAPDGRALMSPRGPAVVIEPADPMGTWILRVRVTDNVRHVSVETEARFIVDTPPTPASPAA